MGSFAFKRVTKSEKVTRQSALATSLSLHLHPSVSKLLCTGFVFALTTAAQYVRRGPQQAQLTVVGSSRLFSVMSLFAGLSGLLVVSHFAL